MLVAAMLFGVGLLIGRVFTVIILAMTSCVIMFTALTIFVSTYGLDILHVLITLGYLAAHQSGYLLGAYCSGYQENN
ncbi:hypothetical protein MMSR116_02830 [Methylobacterium mesophilicum SR1.6/6]|uniref:Uncharacterized protein n=1 Tax=Methylobacterium mesophilicum SR1.6/6 TaxID=908290 RepID=A0A6B9FJ74_9HYPH|nr:hypothetical protein [Methylobacterium mesophilicum]QGY00948.1 hypothetical protein MMSR116_02830 [Methylobacterium mesophilicum SR1.6/6]